MRARTRATGSKRGLTAVRKEGGWLVSGIGGLSRMSQRRDGGGVKVCHCQRELRQGMYVGQAR
ncbi:hypothetical protein K438DRAFT_1857773 [Mycena galopus ATCC 62051]|nr:hypothetical protein K438DRAFT_1857773 [Mycena galopus ATCC 62051]